MIPISVTTKAFNLQSFVPGSRPRSGEMGLHHWWFLAWIKQLHKASIIFKGKLNVDITWQIIQKQSKSLRLFGGQMCLGEFAQDVATVTESSIPIFKMCAKSAQI